MIKILLRNNIIRLCCLLAVIPLVIGHGTGCGTDCTVEERSFVLSGSIDSGTDISISNSINIVAKNIFYISPASAKNTTIPAITYVDTVPHKVNVTINSSGSGGDTIGEMWAHSNGQKTKLVHPAISPSYLNTTFGIGNNTLPQSSTIASSSMYTLSAGSTGSESLLLRAYVEIFVNNVSIFTRTYADNIYVAPIMFTATTGDTLKIVAGGTEGSESVSSFWLHTPSGAGIKLLSGALDRNWENTGVFIDVSYILP